MRPILLFLVALAFAGSGCTQDAGPAPGDSSADPATTSGSDGGDASPTSSGMSGPAGSEDPAGAAPPAPESSEAPGYTRESARELLVRTWVIDTEQMMQSEQFDEMTPEQAQQARAMIALIQMEMTFTDTQVTTTMGMLGESQTDTADYEIARIEGDEIILTATDADGRNDEITVTHDGERLTFRAADGHFVLREKE